MSYPAIKAWILGWVPLSADATLILFGLVVTVLGAMLIRAPLSRLRAALPALVVGGGMEAADVTLLGQPVGVAAVHLALVVLPTLALVLVMRQGWVRG